jgi:hypothetical protein
VLCCLPIDDDEALLAIANAVHYSLNELLSIGRDELVTRLAQPRHRLIANDLLLAFETDVAIVPSD